jgi:acyl-coenzyme A thioesterase PaaI-like protein
MARLEMVETCAGDLFGVREHDQRGETVSATMTLGDHHLGPGVRTAVGSLGVMVDEVLGYAIMASLPAGSWSISTEIWVDVLRPVPPVGAQLRAEARAIAPGSFAVGRVLDDAGVPVAECRERGRWISRPAMAVPAAGAGSGDAGSRGRGSAGLASRGPGSAGLSALLGLVQREEASRGRLPVIRPLTNPSEVLHGGASFAGCEELATAARVAAGCDLPTTSVHIVHTRPAPLDSVLELTVRTVHAGRSLWLNDVTASVEGKVCATARVTAQV